MVRSCCSWRSATDNSSAETYSGCNGGPHTSSTDSRKKTPLLVCSPSCTPLCRGGRGMCPTPCHARSTSEPVTRPRMSNAAMSECSARCAERGPQPLAAGSTCSRQLHAKSARCCDGNAPKCCNWKYHPILQGPSSAPVLWAVGPDVACPCSCSVQRWQTEEPSSTLPLYQHRVGRWGWGAATARLWVVQSEDVRSS